MNLKYLVIFLAIIPMTLALTDVPYNLEPGIDISIQDRCNQTTDTATYAYSNGSFEENTRPIYLSGCVGTIRIENRRTGNADDLSDIDFVLYDSLNHFTAANPFTCTNIGFTSDPGAGNVEITQGQLPDGSSATSDYYWFHINQLEAGAHIDCNYTLGSGLANNVLNISIESREAGTSNVLATLPSGQDTNLDILIRFKNDAEDGTEEISSLVMYFEDMIGTASYTAEDGSPSGVGPDTAHSIIGTTNEGTCGTSLPAGSTCQIQLNFTVNPGTVPATSRNELLRFEFVYSVDYSIAGWTFYNWKTTTNENVMVDGRGRGDVRVIKVRDPDGNETNTEDISAWQTDSDDWGSNMYLANQADNYIYNVTYMTLWIASSMTKDPNDISTDLTLTEGANTWNIDTPSPGEQLLWRREHNLDLPAGSYMVFNGTVYASEPTSAQLNGTEWIVYNWTENTTANRGAIPVYWAKANFTLATSEYDNLDPDGKSGEYEDLGTTGGESNHNNAGTEYSLFVWVIKGYYVRVTKEVRYSTTVANRVEITLRLVNLGNEDTPQLYVYDLIPTGFTYVDQSATIEPSDHLVGDPYDANNQFTGNQSVSGTWSGVSMWWFIDSLEESGTYPDSVNITYNVSGTGTYNYRDLFIVGLDPLKTVGDAVTIPGSAALIHAPVKKTSVEVLFIVVAGLLLIAGILSRKRK